MPLFKEDPDDLAAYVEKRGAKTGQWANLDRYLVSLLKAYYGEAAPGGATTTGCAGCRASPAITRTWPIGSRWRTARSKGCSSWATTPPSPVPTPGSSAARWPSSKWMVVRDLVETETASFWYDSPEVKRGDLVTADIDTEVFLLPAAGHAEKAGTFTNTQRLLQFREKAVDPPGDARSELWFVHHLARRLKEKARGDARSRNAGLNALTWDYATSGPAAEPDAEEVLREINGYVVADRTQVPGFGALKSDGTTACGCWIYAGRVPGPGSRIAPPPAMRKARTARAGASPGRRTGASSTTVPPRVRTASPGARRRSSCGGTRSKREWTGLDTPGLHAHQAARLHAASECAPVTRPWPATSRSSSMRTAWDGSGSRWACATVPCPRTTSPGNRR